MKLQITNFKFQILCKGLMAAKIITFLLILLINVGVGVGFVFFLMLGLNGSSERDANYAFGGFIAGGLLVSFLMATAGLLLVKFLNKKQWNTVLTVLLSVVSFAALGFVLNVVIFFIAIFVAGYVRTGR
jgi:hypothetical protein